MEPLLLAVLVVLAIVAVRLRDLVGATAMLGAYSLVMAMLWCEMNALDVGFTEAAVGAGISTVLMLAAINRMSRFVRGAGFGPLLTPVLRSMAWRNEISRERGDLAPRSARWGALLVCLLVGATLVYAAKDMPRVGDPNSPANRHPNVSRRFIEASADVRNEEDEITEYGEVGPANIVTSVLGDYRGYDTMGETVVIFAAALCVLLVLRQAGPVPRSSRKEDADAR